MLVHSGSVPGTDGGDRRADLGATFEGPGHRRDRGVGREPLGRAWRQTTVGEVDIVPHRAGPRRRRSPSVRVLSAVEPGTQLYAGTATVFESKDHGPELP